jgi:hypothetical protein
MKKSNYIVKWISSHNKSNNTFVQLGVKKQMLYSEILILEYPNDASYTSRW